MATNDRLQAPIGRGSSEYLAAGLAVFICGYSGFSLIYCVQAILPAFSRLFAISPAESSLALSLPMASLAFSIPIMSAVTRRFDKKTIVFVSMLSAAGLTVAAALTPDWHVFLGLRTLLGVSLGGLPAVAIAWIAEEIDARHSATIVGLYVGGTAFGAMLGRVGTGIIAEFVSWRFALGGLGLLSAAAAILFVFTLPHARACQSVPHINVQAHMLAWSRHLRNRSLLGAYFLGCLSASIFMILFNYTAFRLSEPPYSLDQATVSMVYLTFSVGIIASPATGLLAIRIGLRRLIAAAFVAMMAGILLTLASSLAATIAGLTLVTAAFFLCHTSVTALVSARAKEHKVYATSLYLFLYYVSSSLSGSLSGWVWQSGGWIALVLLLSALSLCGVLFSFAPATRRFA